MRKDHLIEALWSSRKILKFENFKKPRRVILLDTKWRIQGEGGGGGGGGVGGCSECLNTPSAEIIINDNVFAVCQIKDPTFHILSVSTLSTPLAEILDTPLNTACPIYMFRTDAQQLTGYATGQPDTQPDSRLRNGTAGCTTGQPVTQRDSRLHNGTAGYATGQPVV